MFWGRPPGRPLTPIVRDAISSHLVEIFQWNTTEMFIVRVGIAEKVLVIGHR